MELQFQVLVKVNEITKSIINFSFCTLCHNKHALVPGGMINTDFIPIFSLHKHFSILKQMKNTAKGTSSYSTEYQDITYIFFLLQLIITFLVSAAKQKYSFSVKFHSSETANEGITFVTVMMWLVSRRQMNRWTGGPCGRPATRNGHRRTIK